MVRYKKITPETAIKRQCKSLMDIKGIFHFHCLQGIGAYRGISDDIVIMDGKFIAIEYKSPVGRQSEHQEQFEKQVVRAGGQYYVVRSLEDLVHGLGLGGEVIL